MEKNKFVVGNIRFLEILRSDSINSSGDRKEGEKEGRRKCECC